MSLYGQLVNAVKATVQGLGISYGASLIPVVVMKRGAVRDGLDNTPRFEITVDDESGVRREKAFAGAWWKYYPVWVQLVVPANLDLTAGLSDYLDWHERLTNLLADREATGIESVGDVQVTNDKPVEGSLTSEGFDTSVVKFVFQVLEDQ